MRDLLTYAFDDIYHKLAWIERIQALDMAAKMGHDKLKAMFELIQLSFLRADMEELFEHRYDLTDML